MTRRSTPVNERLLEDPAGLRIQPPAPANRLVGDGAGLIVTDTGRMVEDGAGLLVARPARPRMVEDGAGLLITEPQALTAAPGEDDVDRSPDPWQEQRAAAAADLARWEARLEAGARKALAAWTAIAATAVLEDRYLTAAPGDGSMLPPDPNAIPALTGTWSKIANTHIVRLVSELLGEVFARFLRDDEVISSRPWQDAYLDEVSNRLVSVADSTFDLVRGVVQDGIDEGASIPDIRDRVQESLDAGGETSWAHRARTIARTETIGAYNGGHLAAWSAVEELTGDPVDKVWLATIDPRTRDSHFRADGQRVALGEPFRVGGHDLAFPGDPTAPAEEVVNCRCTMLELDPSDPLPDVSERGFRDADEVAAEIARRADLEPAVVRAFDDPEASLQAAAKRPLLDLFRAAMDQPQANYDADGLALPRPDAAATTRPGAGFVARMEAIFRASYADTSDPLLVDEAVVDPALLAAELGRALTAAGLGGLARGDAFDPNQKRDENGKWTKHGVGISIKVKGGDDEHASFAAPTEALLRVAFEHDLTGSDGKRYRSRVTTVDVRAGLSDVQGVLEDADGNRVGKFERTIRQTADGPQAYHGSLVLDKEHQGLGLGSEFNQKAEAVYRAAGVTHVATAATSTLQTGYVGGYVWARRGFGWADEFGPKRAATALRQASPYKNPDPAVADMIERLQTGPLDQRPTPWDVSELQGTMHPELAAGGDRRVGRTALLNTTWNGVRWLPAEEEVAQEKPTPKKPASGVPAVTVLNWEDHSGGTEWQREADPQVRAAMLWASTYEGMGAIRQTMRNLDAGKDDPLAGLEVLDPQGRGRDPFDPEGRLALQTEANDRNGGPALSQRKIVYGPDELRAEVLAGAHTLRDMLADAQPTTVPLYRAMRVDNPEALFAPGTAVDLDMSSATPKRNIAELYLPEDRWRKGNEPVLMVIAPGATAVNIDGGRMLGGFRGSDEHLVTGQLTVTGVSRNEHGVLVVEAAAGAAPAAAAAPAASPGQALTGADADAALRDLIGHTAEPSKAELAALDNYGDRGFLAMNHHLRKVKNGVKASAQDKRDIKALTALADRYPLDQPVEVWRGLGDAGILPPPGKAVGTVLTDRGLMSTTTDPAVAGKFSGGPDSALLRITIPAGQPAIPHGEIWAKKYPFAGNTEHELILPPGASLRITGEERDERGRRIVNAEVLPAGGPTAKAAVKAAEVPVPAVPDAPVLNQDQGESEAEPVRGGLADADLADLAAAGGPASGPERLALESYRGEDYRVMNAHLRGLMTAPLAEETAQHLDVLRGLADRHRLTWPVEVYRGVMTPDAILPPRGEAVGTVITDPGFMSTATAHDVATDFAIGPKSALFRITVPEGHPVIPMDGLIGVSDAEVETGGEEHELVLPPGSALRITGEETDETGRRVIVATVLPYGSPEAKAAAAAAAPVEAPAAAAPLSGDDALAAASALVPARLEGAEHLALRSYTGLGYGEMNRYLRGTGTLHEGVRDEVVGNIEALRAVADRHRLTEPIVVMRGQQRANDVIPGGAVGAVITDPGFMSTTTDLQTAEGFAGVRLSESALLEITVPAGHPVLPVDALYVGPDKAATSWLGESEMVLPPGSALRVTGERRDDKGRRIVTAEALEYQGEEAQAAAAAGTVAGLSEKLTIPQLEALDWFVSGDFYGDDPMPDEAIVAGLKARGLLEPISADGPAWKLMLTPKGHEALDTGMAAPAASTALSGADADRMLSALVTEDLEPESDMALQNYILSGYRATNAHLRGLTDGEAHPDLLAEIDGLRAAADAHRLTAPIEAWRGLMAADRILPPRGQAVGTVVTDPAFMSVSLDRAVAHNFGNDRDAALLQITVPEGHPVIPVDQLFAGAGEELSPPEEREFEVVLPPGSSLRITGETEDPNGRRVITAEVLPYGEAAPDVDVPAVEEPATPARSYRTLLVPSEGDAFLREHFDPKALSKPEKEALGFWTNGTNYRQVNELLRTGSLDVKVMTFRGKFEPNPAGGLTRLEAPRYETHTVHSPDEIRAVAALADGGAAQAPSLTRLADQLDNLPAAIDRHQLPEDMSLFRVAALPELAHADPVSLVGRTISDRGYVATSTSEKSAVLVTQEALGVSDDAVLFEIRTPAGTPFATPEIKLGTVNGQKLGGYTRVQEVLLHPSAFRVVEVRDDEVSTDGYSLKNGALVTYDGKAKRSATKVRRIVVELVDPADAAVPAPTVVPAVAPAAPEIARVTTWTPEQARAALADADRSSDGSEYMARAFEDADAFGDVEVLVAEDADGRPLAALSLVRHTAAEEGDTDFLLISYLGSTTPGGGRALADEARQLAIEQNEKLYLEATPTSIGFWTHMGAVEDPYDEGSYYLGFPETFMGQEPEDDDAPALAPEKVTADVPPAVVDVPAAPAAAAPVVTAVSPGAPPVKLTAPRVAALEYYDVAPGERSGKAPNYSVYMPLVKAGLVEKDANGRLVLTDAGRDARTTPGAPEAAPPAPDAPVEPAGASAATAPSPAVADEARLSGVAAFEAFGADTDLDPAGQAVIMEYREGGIYRDLNSGLRAADADASGAAFEEHLRSTGGDLGDYRGGDRGALLAQRTTELDAAIAAAPPLEQPVTLFRGVTSLADVFGTTDPDALVGSTLVDPAFMSTAANKDIARMFGTPATEGHMFYRGTGGALIRINTPAGTRAVRMGDYEAGRGESEVLLPRGSSLRVSAVSTEKLWDGQDWTVLDVDLIPADDRRDATPGAPAEAAPAASRPSAAPDSPADSADAGDGAAAALAAEQAAAEAKAEKKRAAAAKRAEKKRAKEEADRAAALEAVNDSSGVPMKLSYDYLSSLSDEEREDVEVHLIEQLTAGDPMAEGRLDDLALFNQAQVAEQEIAEQEDRLGTLGVSEEITAWHERNGRPGLTHPLVGGSGSTGDVLGVPSMKQVQEEYRQFVYEQWLKAEEATNGYMVTPRGQRLGKTGLDMFSSHRGVADVMQYASEELLNWFEENRRIAWAEFYYERTRSSGYAEKAAAAKAVSLQINRDRTALKASAGLPTTVALVAAARRAPAAPVEPTEAQLDAYAAGRAAATAGEPATVCPFAPSKDAKDHHGLFTLWVRGYVAGTVAAFTARRVAEGLLPDPTLDRLGWGEGDVAVLEPTAYAGDPADRLLALEGELVMGAAGVALTASARLSGHTVTAAGSGPGDSSATEGRPPMPRTWVSAPHLAPFGVPTGDGRIFKVGSLTNRELPLPLLFQPSSGMGHDGSVVVGRILAVEFTEAGIVASGDYLDADPDKAPDLSKAIEQAVALTESGLGHVSVDLSDVVGELVDEDGNPVEMEDIFDAWDRGEDPKVLEQISEGKLIAVTQVATPAFEGAKIELSAAAVVDVDAEAALTDEAGAAIAVGAVVDVETDEGAIRGEVTAVDEESETVTVQPTDDDGAPAGDPLEVAPAAITVVTPAADEAPDAEDAAAEQVASLVAAAGPLRPPAAWFEDPKLPGPTAMTITDDGRIYGHVAVWGACHVGFSNTCVTPPESPSSYKHFHVGEVVTEDGSRVAVGNLTLGGRHADVRLAYRSAIEHYDVSGAGVGVVRCYEDEYGIAFAGALTPGTTEEQIYDMRRSPVSGDWRRVGGELEMIGVLSVNAGGFNTPRFATDEAGRTALVAAPSVRPMDEEAIVAAAGGGRRSTGVLSQRELIARITRDATAAVRRELAEESSRAERNRRLAGLAVSIKADPRSRLQRLAATVDAPKRQARASRLAELADLVGSR